MEFTERLIFVFLAVSYPFALRAFYAEEKYAQAFIHALVRLAFLALIVAVSQKKFFGQTKRLAIRFAYPLAVHAFIYAEASYICAESPSGFHDDIAIWLDEVILGCSPKLGCGSAYRWWIPSRLLGEYFYICYFSYYLLMPSLWLATLLVQPRHDELNTRKLFERARFMCMACVLSPFVLYYLFPVAGPASVYGLPDPASTGYLFSRICNALVSGGGSPGTAFPSSHSILAICTLYVSRSAVPAHLTTAYAILVPGLVLGTVWCGFHYVADAAYSAILTVVVLAVSEKIWRSRKPAYALLTDFQYKV